MAEYDFHEINAACVKRTADALAEGHELALELERKIIDMKQEREEQFKETNDRIDKIEKSILLLTESFSGPSGYLSVLTSIKEAMQSMATNMGAMEKRLVKLEYNEEQENKAREPWIKILFSLIEKVAWGTLVFLAGRYFFK